ncbi:hypothetical protein PFICI_15149 [Pestalotiopsis fici W106-1]|uniref:Zn(2)-C6 fungal-type domain-containing protein n=1 Tax=Pestalotiopsis fici (strain W106-1 / CGMCC3.15140) TaxID=1229662 RepID=W3WHE0_PESFW|nr:uncharacterized protein PFICI_15149 [Pestalotiopsis fici W106-1]ETS73204.1 hypothetical protein PFICI_15149 [Pestalotiopsis fici W106-1]
MDNLLRPLRPVEGANIGGTTQQVQPSRLGASAAAIISPASALHSPATTTAATTTTTITSSGNTPDSSKKLTCLQCRVRKVKCDGRQDVCRNCERLEFECSFQQQSRGQPTAQYAAKLPERRRRMQACLSCRSKKIRCLGELPECSNCSKKGLSCNYPEPRKKLPAIPPGHGSDNYNISNSNTSSVDHDGQSDLDITGSTGEAALDQDTLSELVEDYFRHLYPLPSYAFLHKPTVVQRCQEGSMDTPLKLAICAITSLLLRRTSLCHDIWIQQAEQSVLRQLAQPSIFRLQALLLIVRYRIESGDFPTAFMLAALAARSAVGLRLNFERAELPPLAQEARRRLFWSLFLLDDFFCVGLREFELCPKETIHLQLPCDEELFEAGQHCRTGTLQQDLLEVPATIGLRGIFLRLVSTRREIMRFIRQVSLREIQPASIATSLQRFEQELECLRAGLSQSEQYSVFNLANSKTQAEFIMLHLSWNQCFCDLYRQFLSGYSEAAPIPVIAGIPLARRQALQQRCEEHAESNIQMVTDFWNNCSRNSILERDTAVCAAEGARIILFLASISSSRPTMEAAIRKAGVCLGFITHFFSHSEATKALRHKLETVIGGYSDRLAVQHKKAIQEPDPPEIRPAARVSQYANSRQRLSVQSLLLQSDFVDDSDQIAVHVSGGGATSRTVRAAAQDGEGLAADASTDATNLDDRMSVDGGQEYNAIASIGEHEGLEATGVQLNPWMGFPGQDDVYGIPGLSGDLDAEY